MIEADHTKKYMVVDGHLITISFSDKPNPDLVSRIKSILLSSDASPHICRGPSDSDKIRQTNEEA